MKKWSIVVLAVIILGQNVWAQDDNRVDLGAGVECNMNTYKYFAGGAALALNYNLLSTLATGLSITASSNVADFTTAETAAMFRWYFLSEGHAGLFAQADAGVLFYMEKSNIGDEIKTMFSGGLRGGFRLPLGAAFYIEPYARGGYPFLFSVGVAAGMRLMPAGDRPERKKRERRKKDVAITEVIAEEDLEIPPEPTEEPTEGRYYIVQPGDSAIIISGKVYGTIYAWDQIAAANDIRNPDELRIGQRLFIPPFRSPDGLRATTVPEPGRYYIVQRGDSLSSISEKVYGSRSGARRIMEANNITDPDMIHIGKQLLIPAEEP